MRKKGNWQEEEDMQKEFHLSGRRFIQALQAPENPHENSLCFAFSKRRLLVRKPGVSFEEGSFEEGGFAEIPCRPALEKTGLPVFGEQYLGSFDDCPCYSFELEEDIEPPGGMALSELPILYGKLKADLLGVAGMALQVTEWRRNNRFCGCCGAPTAPRKKDRAMVCPECGIRFYPRITPAVLVLISRDKELLLARSPRFPPGAYCLVAGFVEPGETVEEAAEREVEEEVGVSIKDLKYFGSQPWPFPHTLMLGFTAKYAGGKIRVDTKEIEDARWFPVERLPPLPTEIGLSKRIITHFIKTYA